MNQVKKSLEKLDVGYNRYVDIMNSFHSTNVASDLEFQRKFNGFYKIRRNAVFREQYYAYMEKNKNIDLTYTEALTHFYNMFGRVESSFSSKLLATINPEMPVWDSIVLNHLNLKNPYYKSSNRLEKTIELYEKINNWYQDFLKTDDAQKWIEEFDKKYMNNNITNIKKIDLILWQMRGE